MTDEEIMDYLAAFAFEHGRRWKSILADAWMSGRDAKFGWQARWIRNHRGPTWLQSYRLG